MTDEMTVITIYISIATLILGVWWGYTLAIVSEKIMTGKRKRGARK